MLARLGLVCTTIKLPGTQKPLKAAVFSVGEMEGVPIKVNLSQIFRRKVVMASLNAPLDGSADSLFVNLID